MSGLKNLKNTGKNSHENKGKSSKSRDLASATSEEAFIPVVEYKGSQYPSIAETTGLRVQRTVSDKLSEMAKERGISRVRLVDAILMNWIKNRDSTWYDEEFKSREFKPPKI